MVGLLGGREESQGLLGDPRKLQALLGYEGMPTPDAAEGMPQYDPEFLKRLGSAIATMPTVQSIKSAVTLPGDVYAGRQPMGLPSETEDLSRVADLAGLAMTGGVAGTGRGGVALGSGPMRRTPELPMDEAARMARAAEQGYTIDAYHGTRAPDFERFGPGKKTSDAPGGMYFFSDNPEIANSYAQGSGGRVLQTKIKLETPAVYDAKGDHWGAIPTGKFEDMSALGLPEPVAVTADINEIARAAKAAGHDGVIIKNVGDWGSKSARNKGTTGDVQIVFAPDQVRSKFAAFDPANEGSGMLLGSTSTDRKGAAALSQGLLGNRERALAEGGSAVSKAMPEFETIFRGENSGNKGGSYYSTDRDWARQFTQTGADKEVHARKISTADIYEPSELPRAVDEHAMDRAMAEAKERGFKAIRVDEGRGEPPSVFILDKSALK